jgi:hypothetical protein
MPRDAEDNDDNESVTSEDEYIYFSDDSDSPATAVTIEKVRVEKLGRPS